MENESFKNLFRYVPILLIVILAITGCDKESGGDGVESEYYVKYEAKGVTIYSVKLHATILDDKNVRRTFTFNKGDTWEMVIGPVKKGFIADMRLAPEVPTHKIALYSSIFVSKDGSPFALKESNNSDSHRDSLLITYRINY
jgi:hypothetical protein